MVQKPPFIGKNSKYVYPKIQSPFFWKGFRVGFCPPSSVRFLPSSVLRPLSSLLCLLSIVFLFSCAKSPVREQLEQAEQVMETDSHAAAAVLDSIDSSVLRGEEAALYAILRTQTDYKRDIPLTSDSLASIATLYYGVPHRKDYHAAMAWYTLGCVYTDQKNDAKAIEAYLKAKDCFPDTTNKYYGLTMQNLGNHYINRNMLEEAIASLNSYFNISHVTKDTISLFFAEYFLGIAYLRSFEYERADRLFDRVLQSPLNQPYYKRTALLNKAKIECYHRKEYAKATNLVNTYRKQLNNDYYFGAGFYLLGDIYKSQEMLDSARYYYQKASDCKEEIYTRCNTYRALVETSLMQDGKADVLEDLYSYGQVLDSVYERRNKDAIVSLGIQNEMEKQELKYRSDKRMLQLYLLILFVVLVLLGCISLILHRSLRKSHSLAVRDDLSHKRLESLRTEWVCWDKLNDEEKEARKNTFIRKLEQCRFIFRETKSDRLLLQIDKGNKNVTAEQRKEILDDVSRSFIDVIQDLRMETLPNSPKISENDWMLCLLSYLKVHINCIADILCIEVVSVRKKRRRLEKKLPSDLLDLFFV
ncbi:MAG: tetratricopeptide repeat protein [Bacteroidaceae bacterium]|nr:tetratricopeptide repeat protein [Bacteroidaceae bacterium]